MPLPAFVLSLTAFTPLTQPRHAVLAAKMAALLTKWGRVCKDSFYPAPILALNTDWREYSVSSRNTAQGRALSKSWQSPRYTPMIVGASFRLRHSKRLSNLMLLPCADRRCTLRGTLPNHCPALGKPKKTIPKTSTAVPSSVFAVLEQFGTSYSSYWLSRIFYPSSFWQAMRWACTSSTG